MTSRMAWTPGLGVGYTLTTAINGSDMVSLANGSSVLSSVADITNQTAQDIFMDVNIQMTVASTTATVGALFGLYAMYLNQDGTTYGSGEMTSGGVITRAPASGLVGSLNLQVTAAATLFSGWISGIQIYPGSLRLALFNGSTFTLSATAANNVVKYRTYNLNLNA